MLSNIAFDVLIINGVATKNCATTIPVGLNTIKK
jgi:hypothetical protein